MPVKMAQGIVTTSSKNAVEAGGGGGVVPAPKAKVKEIVECEGVLVT